MVKRRVTPELVELRQQLKQAVASGLVACPRENYLRRQESAEVEKDWEEIENLLERISFGLETLHSPKRIENELITAHDCGNVSQTHRDLCANPYRIFLNRNPEEDDARYQRFKKAQLRIQVNLPIQDWEIDSRKNSRENFEKKIKPAILKERAVSAG